MELPERLKWNARYSAPGYAPSFAPHPLAARALGLPMPAGPVLELACGPSGSALHAAALGRMITAVDASEVALGLLSDQARARRLAHRITVVAADLRQWRPGPPGYALVLATGYWDRALFAVAADAVLDGGLLAWEALTLAARSGHPSIPADWCLRPGEPASLLPAAFTVLSQEEAGHPPGSRRRMIARRGGPG